MILTGPSIPEGLSEVVRWRDARMRTSVCTVLRKAVLYALKLQSGASSCAAVAA